ncbi:ABC transporter ATP-binding protein [Novosphingopyxis sp.]|uniref:ABC transporter ATP-binding protein n=1 Tax=Novosphingopyxis sp. TaxID=2709690 RepID=UPI003B593610
MELTATDLVLLLGETRALDGVSAAFQPGCITVLLGPNGAGKSSLLKCLVGLAEPEGGRVMLGGAPLRSLKPRERARRIAYLAQEPTVHWNLAAKELVALGRLPHRGPYGGPSQADEAAVAKALSDTETMHFAARPIHSLSGGERARVLLARLLAGEPQWLLADEPLASLDPAHQLDMLRLFRSAANHGAGVLLVLHDLNQAARIADDVLILKQGRIAAAGAAADVLSARLLSDVYETPIGEAAGPDGQRLFYAGQA